MKILNDRNITSSQKGFENVVEGTKYDDYHIDTNGMGILSVENIIEEIEGRGNQAVLTVQTSSGSTNHSQFSSKDWKEYKDSVNNAGNAITDVWITEVEGGSYVRNSRRIIKSSIVRDIDFKSAIEDVRREFSKEWMPNGSVHKAEGMRNTQEAVFRNRVNDYWISIYWTIEDDGEDSFYGIILDEWGDTVFESEHLGIMYAPDIDKIIRDIMIQCVDYSKKRSLSLNSSRRPIKSGWVFIASIGDASIFEENDKYLVTLEKGANVVEEYFNDEASAKEFAKEITSSFIHSARYIATDPESGEVLGSADTYEEAVQQWGEDVTITDSEAAEGNEQQSELFQSRRPIKSAIDGGWEVRSSDVPKALDLFVEYFGEEDALEEIAKAMGDATLEENIDWIAQQWGFAEDIEELDDAWDKYETAKEIMGESELFNNLTQAAGYDELAEDLAFIFRMNDFREWDEVSGYDDEDEDDDEVSDDEMYSDIDWRIDGDLSSNLTDCDIEDPTQFILDKYLAKGGEFYPKDKYSDAMISDKDIFNEVVDYWKGISAQYVEYWENDEDPEGFNEWLKKNYPSEEITSSVRNIKSSLQNSFPVKTVKNILSGKWSEDYAAECIAQKQDINVGYAKQILSSWIEEYKPKLIKSGILDIAEDINQEFDIDGDLESWAEQYTNDSGKANTVGGEIVRAAMQIIYRYNNDGDMIGCGYGNETVNAAARYLIEKVDMTVNEQIQKWLDHEERASDSEYDSFIESLQTEVEDALRTNSSLFQKPNKDDYWDWKTEDDVDVGFDECYLEDGDGNQYWFQKVSDDRWTCTGIELDPYTHTYSEGDTINEGDELSDEILSPGEEFGSFEAEGLIYE